jgi:anti-sigma regulatory factor (Ser/Thr protein kinase)
MSEDSRQPRVHDRDAGLRALQFELDRCALDGTELTAAFLDGGPVAGDTRRSSNGNGARPVPRLAAPLARQSRGTDLIVLLGGETLLWALPGVGPDEGRRRLGGVVERLGAGSIRLGVAGPVDGESALELLANAEAAAPLSADGGSTTRLSLRLPAELVAARKARTALRLFEGDLCGDDYTLLALVVTELVTNGVRHGSVSTTDSVLLEVVVGAHGVLGTVVDQGAGFDPITAGPQGTGLGLTIVERATRRWGTSDHGRRVWFELPPTAPARPATLD